MSNESGKKKRPLYTPASVQNRVLDRHMNGESQREIAKQEGIDRATVKRILSQKEFLDAFVMQRSRLVSLAEKATTIVENALGSENQKVALSAAYKILDAVAAMDQTLASDLTWTLEHDAEFRDKDGYESVLGIPRKPPRVARAKANRSAQQRKT